MAASATEAAGGHIGDLEASDLVQGVLLDSAARRLRAHCVDCEDCREFVAAVARALVEPDHRHFHEGGMCGRYRLLTVVGRGGMGEVWSAWDPDLDRRVAIKTMRAELDELAVDTLRREAEALARLAHPGVVAVLEMIRCDDFTALVMEFVDGDTLTRWQRDPVRTGDEILDAYLQAGHGLAAAHAAGVVHRDFKPQNVVIGVDGRARVVDFGLSTIGPEVHAQLRTYEDYSSPRPRTISGGTPGFMAPEVMDGVRGDARSDQFSFCVALWEALARSLPYAVDELSSNTRASGQARLRPPHRPIPPAIVRVLRRGLHPDSGRRFTDMLELIAALQRARRGSALLWPFASVAVGVLLCIAAWQAPGPDARPQCARAREAMASTWNSDVARDAAAVAGVNAGAEPAVAGDVRRQLGGWVDGWTAELELACEGPATHAAADAKCLDDQRRAFAAVVERTLRVGSDGAEHLDEPARFLPRPRECRHSSTATIDADASELRHRIWLTRGEVESRLDATTHARARALLDQAEAMGDASLIARARVTYGYILREDGQIDSARTQLELAYQQASALGDEVSMAEAAEGVAVCASKSGDTEAALTWLRHMEAAIAPDDLGTLAQVAALRGSVFLDLGDLDRAEAELARGAAMAPRDHPVRALLLDRQGALYFDQGRKDDALHVILEQLEVTEAHFGADHQNLVSPLISLGVLNSAMHRFPAAHAAFIRALGIATSGRPGSPLAAAFVRANHSQVFDAMGDSSTALASMHDARVAIEEVLGERSPDLARMLQDEATYAVRVARWTDALTLADRVIDIYGGAANTHCYVLHTRAKALGGLARVDEALAAWDDALTCPPGDDDSYGRSHHGRAALLAELGRWSEADDAVERARSHYATSSITADFPKADLALLRARIAVQLGRPQVARTAIEQGRRLLGGPLVSGRHVAGLVALEALAAELGP